MAKRRAFLSRFFSGNTYNGPVNRGDQLNGPINNSAVGGQGNTNQIVNINEQHNYNGNIVWDTSGIKQIHRDVRKPNEVGVSDTPLERVMEILRRHIAPGAFHDSAERGDPPKCHEKTRQAVLKQIMDWLQDQDNQHLFLWLFGPAGAGKTAIAGTIAEMAQRSKLLAATFFFSRSAAGRNTKNSFIVTLAYQLAQFIPEMTFYLKLALDKDPAIFSRSLSSQLQILIVGPLNSVIVNSEIKSTTAILIIVDGLDECDNASNAHQYILKLLLEYSTTSKYPIRFLVASRPEWQIRQPFSGGDLAATTMHLALDDDYRADDDIKALLVSEFTRIRMNHPASEDIPRHWPPGSDIQKLVKKASRQFIYASTVIKFIDCDEDDPVKRLKIILGLSPVGDLTPFAQLDAIYLYILTSGIPAASPDDTMTLLLIILLGKEHSFDIVASILGCSSTCLKILLNGLNALVGSSQGRLFMYHASFGDFLFTPLRAGCFHISTESAHERIAICCIQSAGKPEARAICLDFGFEVAMFADHIIFHLERLSLTEKLRVLLQDMNLVKCIGLDRLPPSPMSTSIHWLDRFVDWLQKATYQGLENHDQTETQTNLKLLYENRIFCFLMEKVDKYPKAIHPSLLIFLSIPNIDVPSQILHQILVNVLTNSLESQPHDVSILLSDNASHDLYLESRHGGMSKAPISISRIFIDALHIRRCSVGECDYANLAINMLPVTLGLDVTDMSSQRTRNMCIEVLARTVLPKAAKDSALGNLIQESWHPPYLSALSWEIESDDSEDDYSEDDWEVEETYDMATCVLVKAGWVYLKKSKIPINVYQHDAASYRACFLCSGRCCTECLTSFDEAGCRHHGSLAFPKFNLPNEFRDLGCCCTMREFGELSDCTKSRKPIFRGILGRGGQYNMKRPPDWHVYDAIQSLE